MQTTGVYVGYKSTLKNSSHVTLEHETLQKRASWFQPLNWSIRLRFA